MVTTYPIRMFVAAVLISAAMLGSASTAEAVQDNQSARSAYVFGPNDRLMIGLWMPKKSAIKPIRSIPTAT
jgi:hypothetical protein